VSGYQALVSEWYSKGVINNSCQQMHSPSLNLLRNLLLFYRVHSMMPGNGCDNDNRNSIVIAIKKIGEPQYVATVV
jgi:hypothetical protein